LLLINSIDFLKILLSIETVIFFWEGGIAVDEKKSASMNDPLSRLKYEIAQEIGLNKKSKRDENEKDIKK